MGEQGSLTPYLQGRKDEHEHKAEAIRKLAAEWKKVAAGLASFAEEDPRHELEHRGRAESYEECAEELLALIAPPEEM